MEGDPWADAPSTSRPSTPTIQTSPTKPTNVTSPLSNRPLPESHSIPSPTPSPPTSPIATSSELAQVSSAAHSPVLPPPSSPPVEVDQEVSDVVAEEPTGDAPADEGDDAFDDFDDFGETAEAGPSDTRPLDALDGGEDDAFGDFGDFEEGDFEETAEEEGVQPDRAFIPEPEPIRWHALNLRPVPPAPELVERLTTLLGPLLVDDGGLLTNEPPRQVGGLSQIMTSESSREAYAQLTTPPMLKTLDWTRSRTRREHLISMGVPVNLDEVDSHRLSSLPPLRITTNPSASSSHPNKRSSTDSYRSSGLDKGKGRAEPSNHGAQSVPVSAVSNGDDKKRREKYGMGSRPLFDSTKAEDLCGVEEDRLSLISLERLKAMQEELVQTSSQASALLAWHLQLKDAQSQDSATYNGMISGLIANAAKAKSAQAAGSGGVFKRASMRRPQSGSPGITPRIGSPSLR